MCLTHCSQKIRRTEKEATSELEPQRELFQLR